MAEYTAATRTTRPRARSPLGPCGVIPRGRVCQSARVIASRTPIELVRPSTLASRATYAYAAVAHDVSRLVFTAGACPLDKNGIIVAVGDVSAQTERVMTNLRIALQEAEADLTDVVKSTVYVASQRREDLLAAWGVVRRHFGDHDAPSTLLGVLVLGYQYQLVEVEAVAALR
ncbi:MAG: RidA family protein [Pseudonocardiales bacterium]|nr:RidA family protein [Pseudonocardiales bacterium]